jgi:hypothetical protein
MRMYGGYGALLGSVITGMLLKFVLDELWDSDQQLLSYAFCGGVAGSMLGRLALVMKIRGYW